MHADVHATTNPLTAYVVWCYSMGMETKPRIFRDGETIDPFQTFDTVPVKARSFRTGMVLVDDELGTAVYSLDHQMRSTRNSGSVRWMVEDLENGGWVEQSFSPGRTFPVAV